MHHCECPVHDLTTEYSHRSERKERVGLATRGAMGRAGAWAGQTADGMILTIERGLL
jgi:hypothetical protein